MAVTVYENKLYVNGGEALTTVAATNAAITDALEDTDTETVTVTGSLGGVEEYFDFTIPEGKKVVWQANVSGSTGNDPLIYAEGSGLFEVAGGKVIQNGTGNTILADNANMVVSGNAEIAANSGHAIYLNDNAATLLEVSGGTITSEDRNAIYLGGENKTVIISGGEVSSSSNTNAVIYTYGDNNVVLVSGGTVTATGTGGKFGVNAGTNGVFIEKTGTETEYLAGTSDDLTITPAEATAAWARQDGKSGVSYVNGGNSGFIEVPGVTVTGTNFKIDNDNEYATLAAAAAAVEANGTITMLNDVTVSNLSQVTLDVVKTYTIDFDNKTLTRLGWETLVVDTGTVTLRNGNLTAAIFVYGGNLIVESGSYSGQNEAIDLRNGTVTIISGAFTGTLDGDKNGCLEGAIRLAPGSAADVFPWKNHANATAVTITTGHAVIAPVENFAVSNSETKYETLVEAAEAVENNGTITMLNNVTTDMYDVRLRTDKTYTIDLDGYALGGYPLSSLTNISLMVDTGTVTVKNGSLTAAVGMYGGELTLKNVSCSASDNDELAAIFCNGGKATLLSSTVTGTVTVNDGELTVESSACNGELAAIYCTGGKVTIISGSFSNTDDSNGLGCIIEDGGEILLASGSTADVNPWKNTAGVMAVTVTAAPNALYVNGGEALTTVTDVNAAIEAALDESDVVTVTGNYRGVAESFHLDIPAGKKVIWKADVSGSITNSIIYADGTGVFEVAGGKVIQNGIGNALYTGTNTVVSGNAEIAANSGLAIMLSGRLEVTGGKITSNAGYAIYLNGENKTAIISGGEVSSSSNTNAVIYAYGDNNAVLVSGGTVTATGTGGKFGITDDNNSVFIEKTGEEMVFAVGSTDDLTVTPAEATATWAKQDGKSGVSYVNGGNSGFIEVAGVTVTGKNTVISVDTTLDELLIEQDDTVTVNAGIQLTVTGTMTNAGTLTLKSDGTNGTATILTPDAIGGTGIANVEQYLAGKTGGSGREWWYVSSPVTGAKTTLFNTGGNRIGYYTETTTSYTDPIAAEEDLAAGRGYVLNLAENDAVYTFTGALNNGAVSVPVSRTGTTAAKRGFNLVGNPYPSYLDWDGVTKTNVQSTIWTRTYEGTEMVFKTYNADAQVGTDDETTAHIAPLQAFWVKVLEEKADISDLTLDFANAQRLHKGAGDAPLRVAQAETQGLVRLEVSNGANKDQTVLVFNENAGNGLNRFDSEKMSNGNAAIPEIYTLAGSEKLVINSMNAIPQNSEITLGFNTGAAGSFTIRATTVSNIDSDLQIILKDKLAGVDFDLTNGEAHAFTSGVANTESRFAILFAPNVTTGISGNTAGKLQAYVSNGQLIIENGKWGDKVEIFNLTGQKLYGETLNGKSHIVNRTFAQGVYLVKVGNDTVKVTVK
ncbi:hypothetical protein FACS189413_12580 [Bacteroidia bacterium]|nr:hypothetical protein FACS189413_12580 [Bacteroidia bacterium]